MILQKARAWIRIYVAIKRTGLDRIQGRIYLRGPRQGCTEGEHVTNRVIAFGVAGLRAYLTE